MRGELIRHLFGSVADGGYTPPTTDLKLWLPFVDDANDDSGQGNNATLFGDAFVGGSPAALQLDGNGDYALLPDSNSIITQNSSWTMGCWAKVTFVTTGPGTTNRALMMYRGSTALTGAVIGFGAVSFNNDRARFTYHNGSVFVNVDIGTISKNTWYHLFLTYNGTIFRSYINGVAGGTSTGAFAGFGSYDANIGSFDGSSNFITGDIGTTLMYDRVLTPTEISDDFDGTKAYYGVT